MAKSFTHLHKKEQIEIFEALSRRIGRSALHLEKDVWLCWALQNLFSLPNHLPMAFKGGTSLSKVFGAINRFSEDVDITLDYQAFNRHDPFDIKISKTKLKNISEQIKVNVTAYLREIVLPYFKNITASQFDNSIQAELDADGETIFICYPSILDQKSPYIENTLRLEFGGRNTTIPNNTYKIKPDIAEHVKELDFPSAEVTVLSPQKTFWEKITLIHYECNRTYLKDDANRISRHWYDIAMLIEHSIGKQAINEIDQLKEVIKIKKAFYGSSYAKYDDCLNGRLRLIPKDEQLKHLEKDFNKMLEEKMFYNSQPNFTNIIQKIRRLENEINSITSKQKQ